MGFSFLNQLPTTEEVKKQYPLSKELIEQKAKRDAEIKSIFRGESKKFLLVIGPCSADHEDPVLEYCHRLKEVAKDVEDQIFIVPRIYTNKPRTTGEGYKGMLHQPDPEKRANLTEGILAIRHMHIRVLENAVFRRRMKCCIRTIIPISMMYYLMWRLELVPLKISNIEW